MRKLTKAQREALFWLVGKHERFPENTYGFVPQGRFLEAQICRRELEPLGLVRVRRLSQTQCLYLITEAGRQALKEAGDA